MRDWQNINALSAVGCDVHVIAIEGHACKVPMLADGREPIVWSTLDEQIASQPLPYDGSEAVLLPDWWNNHLGHPIDLIWSPFRAAALRRTLKRSTFDFAVVEDITLWRYTEIVRGECPTIVDHQNIQSHLEDEYCSALPLNKKEKSRRNVAASSMRAIERRFVNCGATVCSTLDLSRLLAVGYRPENVAVVPNCIMNAGGSFRGGTARHSAMVLFPATLNYYPNILAAFDLIDGIFPLVRRLVPHAQLSLVGLNPGTDLLLAARRQAGVTVTPNVGDITPFFREASLVAVPLRVGGGTRLKILEAFSHGAAVVSSSKGYEGLDVEPGEHLLRADSIELQASEIATLLVDQCRRAAIAERAFAFVVEHHKFERAKDAWAECLARWFC